MPNQCEEGECSWQFIPDWYGNPDIPDGTRDCSYFYCSECDTSVDDQPEGFEFYHPREEY